MGDYLGGQPPKTNGGLGAKPPAAGGFQDSLELAYSFRRRHGVWGRSPQRSKIFHFLQKELNFRATLIKNNAFKTWHRNWQRNVIQVVALMGFVGGG